MWRRATLRGASSQATLGDLINIYLYTEDVTPNTDHILWAALTVGALSASSFGLGVALEAVGGVWRVQYLSNIGAGWVITNALATSGSTVGAVAQVVMGNDDNQGRGNAYPLDGSGNPVGVVTPPTAPIIHNGWLASVHPDTFTAGAGWATGVGGVADSEARLSARLVLVPRLAVQGLAG